MSSAHIEGAAILSNPHLISTKTVIFDASFYVGPGQSLLAALKYYNKEGLVFEDEETYFVHASVSPIIVPSLGHFLTVY